MSSLCVLILASTLTLSSAYTVISGTFTEDWKYTSTPPELTESESWWYNPTYGAFDDLDQTASSPQDGQVWGWFRKASDDPSSTIARDFMCSSYATVTVTLNVYFCISGSAGSQTTFWYRRSGLGTPISVEYNKNGDGYGSWSSRGTGVCGNTVKKTQVTDTFSTNGLFTLSFTKKLSEGSSSSNSQVVAFNNVRVVCSKIPTPGPTRSPTSETNNPTKKATKTPTNLPTGRPSGQPTKKPTYPPTSPRPTHPPTTVSPTPRPSTNPSAKPTPGPTPRPTDNPTEKPTLKPTDGPSYAPTAERKGSRIFTDAFGMTASDCVVEDLSSWIRCNLVMFILICVCIVVFCCYWICGVLWYKRRQRHRYDEMPTALATHDGNVQMSAAGGHITSDKWKSAWEM
eukprot:243406_1